MRDDELLFILDGFQGRTILVVGDVMLDEYLVGIARRISPEAPTPIVEVRKRYCAPGGAANTAVNAASLGGRVLLGGVVGQDANAKELQAALFRSTVTREGLIEDGNRPTTTKTRAIAQGQQVIRIDSESCASLSADLEDQLCDWIDEQIPSVSACVLSDYGKGVVSRRLAGWLIRAARSAGKPVIVDPKGADYSKYRGATIVTPNVEEAQRAVGRQIDHDADLLAAAREISDIVDSAGVLITRGPEGMALFVRGGATLEIPAAAREVFDVTGAGDTVVGMLAMALASGASLEQAAVLANHAAGLVVGKLGTATVTLAEMRLAIISADRIAWEQPVQAF